MSLEQPTPQRDDKNEIVPSKERLEQIKRAFEFVRQSPILRYDRHTERFFNAACIHNNREIDPEAFVLHRAIMLEERSVRARRDLSVKMNPEAAAAATDTDEEYYASPEVIHSSGWQNDNQ